MTAIPSGNMNAAGETTPAAEKPEAAAIKTEESGKAAEKSSEFARETRHRGSERLRVKADTSVLQKREKVIRTKFSGTSGNSGIKTSGKSAVASLYSAAPENAAKSAPVFGDMPPTEILRPRGHSKINLSVKWVSKQADGLYLQSQYGTLRISPVGSGILRITFARGTAVKSDTHPQITWRKIDRSWRYRDNGRVVELTTGEITVQVEKAAGAVRYLDGKGKLLLSERKTESRQCDEKGSWLFLELQKNEQLFVGTFNPAAQGALKLRGSARYISTGTGFPLLLSDQGYGLLPASSGTVISCDIPAYGTYLYMDGQPQQDYYFIAGKQQQNILNAYRLLIGDL